MYTTFKNCFLIFTLISSLTACNPNENQDNSNKDSISNKDSLSILYAKGFSAQYFDHYKLVKVFSPFKESKDTLHYILYQRGTKKPEGYPKATFVEVPLQKIVVSSTTHAALIHALDRNNTLVGISGGQYISNEKIRQLMKEGKITEVGTASGVNEEMMLAIGPDALMISGMSAKQLNAYSKLTSSGIQLIVNAEWLENTPLGRAEWIKFMALFYNQEKEATQQFDYIVKEYDKMSELAKKATKKPKIIAGLPFKDVWYISGGKSYMAQFYKDANCTFHWADDPESGSLALSFEAVYPIALEADFWLGIGTVNSSEELLAFDKRYGDFNSFKNKQLYNNTKRAIEGGGNDFWESGFLNPHLILADFLKIMHPELLPEYELYYYKKLK